MKQVLIPLVVLFMTFSCKYTSQPRTISLFDGTDLKGWQEDVPAMDKNPDTLNPFIVRNGLLVSLGTPGENLITDSVYQNNRLEVECRFTGKSEN